MNFDNYKQFLSNYIEGNESSCREYLSELIHEEIDVIENSRYGDVDFKPLFQVFDNVVAAFVANGDIRNALRIYLHLFIALNKWSKKAPGTKNFPYTSCRYSVPGKVMLGLFELVKEYMEYRDIPLEKHADFLMNFIDIFRKYLKEKHQPDDVEKGMRGYSDLFPQNLGFIDWINIESYISDHLFCGPFELKPNLMVTLARDKKRIPSDTVLVPYMNAATNKWGFKDKESGHVVVTAEYHSIECDGEWSEGEVWVCKTMTGFTNYFKLDRDQKLEYVTAPFDHRLVKVDGLGYFFDRHNILQNHYYDINRQKCITPTEVAFYFGEIIKKNSLGYLIFCSKDKEMRPLKDVTNCEIVKFIQQYAPRVVALGFLTSLIYVFLSQLIFLSDISIVNLWHEMGPVLKLLYSIGVLLYVLGIPYLFEILLCLKIPFFKSHGESYQVMSEQEMTLASTLSSLAEFWSILGVFALLGKTGFWPYAGLIACSIAGIVSLWLTLSALSGRPKIKGMKLLLGSRLFWMIISQIAIAANLAIAQFCFFN